MHDLCCKRFQVEEIDSKIGWREAFNGYFLSLESKGVFFDIQRCTDWLADHTDTLTDTLMDCLRFSAARKPTYHSTSNIRLMNIDDQNGHN